MNLDVIIPTKNEEANISELLLRLDKAMKQANINYSVFVVDDHSIDQTSEIVRSLQRALPLTLVLKKGKPGKAYSILEGSKLGKNELVAMIDADLQYPPELLPKLVKIAQEKGVGIGNRTKRHTSALRAFASKTNKVLFGRMVLGIKGDVQSGIKVFRREIIEHVSVSDVSPWTLDMPLLHTAIALGYKIGSADMAFNERKGGQSKVRFMKTSLEIASRAVKLRFRRQKTYKLQSAHEHGLGSGYAFRKKRFITHTNLSQKQSAMQTFTGGQKIFIFLALGLFAAGLVLKTLPTMIILVAILTVIYFADVVFSSIVLLKSLHFPPELSIPEDEARALSDKSLPIYSILCPLYREAHILPLFLESINGLEYPKEKLDVLLLLEEDDKETIAAANKMDLPSWVRIIVVPDSLPKTKPKACNYGLHFAKGEYVVIYDAEDRPDPLQLKKVAIAFSKVGQKVFCLQCKLNYFNPTHNLLTRLFTAEYSLWFDVILPGLQSIEATIPLGGTSNHFRRKQLLSLNAWDPFNVTEDADLGVRLFKAGYKTAIVDSTTLEEANSKVKNWIRQRSRWIKGYFQTYLVHMRSPLTFFREFGVQAVIFQLVIGMRMSFMLINPFLWIITIAYFTLYRFVGPTIESLYPQVVFYLAAFALVVGNFMYIFNYMIGCAKRGHWGLIKFVFFIPLYWIITSIAAFMALYQLIVKPHFWEKTHHGLNLKPAIKSKEVLLPTKAAKPIAAAHPIRSRQIVSGASALILASIVTNGLNFIYSIYLGRVIGIEEYGVLSVFSSLVTLMQVPLSAFSRTMTHKFALLLGKFDAPHVTYWKRMRSASWLPSIALAIAWIAATPFLAQFFNTDSIVPFLLITPLWLIGLPGSIDSGFLSGNLQFSFVAYLTVFEVAIKFTLTAALIYFNHKELIYFAIPFSSLISFIGGYVLAKRVKGIQTDTLSAQTYKVPLKFYFSSLSTKLASIVFLSGDVLLAKHFLSPFEAGEYALLSLVGKMVFFLGTLFTQFVNPLTSRDVGRGESGTKTFYTLIGAATLAGVIGFLLFGVFGSITVPLLLGQERTWVIIPFLAPYTLAMATLTITNGVVSFHQSRDKHLFAFSSFLFAFLMILGMVMRHSSISDISWVLTSVSITYLGTVLALHIVTALTFVSKVEPRTQKEKKLRILFLNWKDAKHKWAGGAEVYVSELARSWAAKGYAVTVLCGNDGKLKRKEVIDGVRIIRLGGSKSIYFLAPLYYNLFLRGTFDAIFESDSALPFFTPLWSRLPSVLLVHHIHQDVFKAHLSWPASALSSFLEGTLMPFVYRNTNIIAASKSTAHDLIRLGFKDSQIEIMQPGIVYKQFSRSKKTPYPSMVYMGRLQHYKNIDVALNAFAQVLSKYPTARFVIAGEGESRRNLEALSKKLGIASSVKFAGRVTHSEKVRLLSSSWIAVQPSSFEGWGITVIEANACGTPVVASRVKGLTDSVLDGKTGLLVTAGNADEWASAIVRLFTAHKFRGALSVRARKWSSQFEWKPITTRALLTLVRAKEMKRFKRFQLMKGGVSA